MFSQSAIEELDFYVYLLQDPRDGQTFYVGKGSGNRVFAHTNEAVELDWSSDKLDQIREIHDAGMEVERLNSIGAVTSWTKSGKSTTQVWRWNRSSCGMG